MKKIDEYMTLAGIIMLIISYFFLFTGNTVMWAVFFINGMTLAVILPD